MENAAALELLHRDAALRAITERKPEVVVGFDGLHCIEPDCGEEIPAGRLALGKVRCIECQRMKESKHG
jgi:hypothetical protein